MYVTAPGAEIEDGHPLVGALAEAHEEVFGAPAERDVTRWFSDASVLTRYGIATVNYGTSSRAARRRARRESRHRRARADGGGVRARGDARLRGRMTHDVYTLPPDLPAPEDDGAADHLLGTMLPQLDARLVAGAGVAARARERAARSLHLSAHRPSRIARRPGWDAIPGARGCTPESCGFRDHAGELGELGALVAGLSAQPLDEQLEFAERNQIPYPVIADPDLRLGKALRLPTFEFEGDTLYKRITLVVQACAIAKVFYPVFPPDKAAGEVIAYLEVRA